jgi:hypothetical protein
MAKDRKHFKKLPGRPFSLFGVRRLWQGPDHLLWVETIMGQEHYRRFYYKDIQAVVLQRTSHHHYWNVLWGVLSLLSGLVTLAAPDLIYVGAVLTVFFLVTLAINWFLGPACTIYLQTAVQLQQITLGRLRKAQRVMDRLKDLIENQQGRIDVSGARHAVRSDSGAALAPENEKIVDPLNPLFHNLLFGILVAVGICKGIQYELGWLALGILDLFLIAIGLVLAAVALLRGHHQIKGRWLGPITWTALVFFILNASIHYIYYIIVIMQNPDMAADQWGLLKKFVEAVTGGHPATSGIQVGSAAIGFILGCAGYPALHTKNGKRIF